MTVQITLFGDFTSAASYVTEAAVWRRAAAGGVTVHCRAVERFPPPEHPAPDAQDGGLEAQILPLAAALGLTLRAPALLPHTRKAHEAARFARERGAEERMRLAIYRAYWADGRDIGRIDVLQELAGEVGLDPVDVKIALDIDRYRDEVVRDEEIARALGIAVPPVVYVGTGPGARILIGAQTPAELDGAIAGG